MSNMYLIRNLLSLKAAEAIDKDYKFNGSVFSIVNTNKQLKSIILKNIENNVNIIDTLELPVFSVGFNIKKQRTIVKKLKIIAEELFVEKYISKLFITYPMHFDSYIYYLTAKKLNVPVCFYEEGPCFYRAGLTKQYEVNNMKDAIRHLYFELCGLRRGYNFKADSWYCSLPIKEKYNKIKIKYNKLCLPIDMKYLFLSRPASEDYQKIKIFDEINAIKKFYNLVCGNDTLFVKFHPRESQAKRITIKNELLKDEIKIEIIEGDMPSEDILFSMSTGAVCGYDTTTLVYANNINDKIEVFSVLKSLINKDPSGFLQECYQEYKSKYKHIHMIDG
jgi:hypothetical protein